ncbi:tetratricopeptide repeat protein [Gallionella capsiferriformans]
MYRDGRGVLQDYMEAIAWFLVAADQGDASAQHNLGAMYASGQGVHQNSVFAYALFNVSATNAHSADKIDGAAANREKLSSSMTAKEIAAAQALSREISQPGMLLKALDRYSKKQAIKEKAMP